MASVAGRRVLVVEDEAVIAMMLACELQDLGCIVVGPAPSVAEALRLTDKKPLDCAVLHYRLGDETSGPIAAALTRRDIPFLFMTGHSVSDLPPELRDKILLQKPVTPKALLSALESILDSAGL